tara:strand:- start:14 stop:538 length:525 start_codon:yes stop_codon:yes gene_type:complete
MAFKMKGPMFFKSALKNYKNPQDYKIFNMGNKPTPFEQSDGDLREWLLGEKGFSQKEADQMITSGAYDVTNKSFLKWYKEKENKNDSKLAEERMDAPVEPEGEGVGQTTPMMNRVTSDVTKLPVNHEHKDKDGNVTETHTYAEPKYYEGTKRIRPGGVDKVGTITPVPKMKKKK